MNMQCKPSLPWQDPLKTTTDMAGPPKTITDMAGPHQNQHRQTSMQVCVLLTGTLSTQSVFD